jgi:co-chaperonin GroES (HSP10)
MSTTTTTAVPASRLRPIAGRALICVDDAPTTSSGVAGQRIYLPDNVQKAEAENYRFGTVVALGDPELHPESGRPIPWAVKPGDRICFQFGADLSGERELAYTGGVLHAMCFAADVLYVIEDAGTLLPIYLNADMVRTAVLHCMDGEGDTLGGLADRIYAFLAGTHPE